MAGSDVIDVAVGVIVDTHRRVLLTQRAAGTHLGGRFEFPGGKVEKNESDFEALKREFDEELGLSIQTAKVVLVIPFDYPEHSVNIKVFYIEQYSGEPQLLAGQTALRWQPADSLAILPFPEANQPIIEWLHTYSQSREQF